MPTAIITRDLLERYLGATGWIPKDDTSGDVYWYAPESWRRLRDSSLDVNDESGAPALETIAVVEDRWRHDVAATLGLCAAADSMLARADLLAGACATSTDLGHRDRAKAWDLAASEMSREAHALLEDAGVDPARWIELAARGDAQGTNPVPAPPATEQASDRDDTAAPLVPPASSGAPVAPGAAGAARHGGEAAGGTAGKTPEEIAREIVFEHPDAGVFRSYLRDLFTLAESVGGGGLVTSGDLIPLPEATSRAGADALVADARGIIARLVQRVREEPASRTIGTIEVAQTHTDFGHLVIEAGGRVRYGELYPDGAASEAMRQALGGQVVRAPDTFAIWDWEREPQPPSARVVVCRPGEMTTPHGHREGQRSAMSEAMSDGAWFVVPDVWTGNEQIGRRIIPAPYAERQADLAGVDALLAVNADRRALVLCPREAMELEEHGAGPWCLDVNTRARIDLVVIIPPPEARACGVCGGDGLERTPTTGPIAFGFDFLEGPCDPCNGLGRIDPWPVHPQWVRSVIKQCRAAGVPVAFMGWGEWVPDEDGACIPFPGILQCEYRPLDAEETMGWYRVSSARSGRFLDGVEVVDVPEWLA